MSAKDGTLQVRLKDSATLAVPVNSVVNDGFTIQVVDGAGVPVADAAVAMRLPEEGPTGSFVDGSKSAVLYTDANGWVKFKQIRWGSDPGKAVVRVTVVKGGLRAGALVEQQIGSTAISLPAVAENSPPAQSPVTIAKASSQAQTPAVPGTPAQVAVARNPAVPAADSQAVQTASTTAPGVSVTNNSGANTGGTARPGVNTKLWVLLAVGAAAAAGIGGALALGGHGAAAVNTAGLTIGAPTISIGHMRRK